MKKKLSLLKPDEAPAIHRADWDHYLRPTPPRRGAFVAIDRSSSVDVLVLPHDPIVLQAGDKDPSGVGVLKHTAEYACEIALQLKGDERITASLLQQEIAKIPAPTGRSILTLLLIGSGQLSKNVAGAVPVCDGSFSFCTFVRPLLYLCVARSCRRRVSGVLSRPAFYIPASKS